jgi:preprotein translocase subunit Sec61beta
MKNLRQVSTPKKVLFIGLGILALGIVVFTIGLQRSPAFWQTFQCGYDLGLNNSSLTRDQISEYCNNQILKTENVDDDLTIVGFGIILIIIGLIITGIGSIWLIARRRGRIQKVSSPGLSMEIMSNRQEEEEKEDDRFTPKKVLIYCLIVGLIFAILSIFIDGLRLLSMAAFVFASITVWYMFAHKFHKWQEREKEQKHI